MLLKQDTQTEELVNTQLELDGMTPKIKSLKVMTVEEAEAY